MTELVMTLTNLSVYLDAVVIEDDINTVTVECCPLTMAGSLVSDPRALCEEAVAGTQFTCTKVQRF